ncbi:GNAT family N-acetyltransferase [Caulobacter sp. SLTY]|uniref:GNAT family N-acetyltransferase n=1 Tax=Caulobacter sp. SLTY TaxID=2683262 RepID=UPI001411FA8B|nr:GNAT family N-acetyltransferase [Caulobacter sp. SLTY]NBB16740.1 GNAT family N-acetyltransferase [Caulobacter sp. SLTY]NBB16760.1 GNAT family N-acetyltransferase [Caulobacter sp. SLTY]
MCLIEQTPRIETRRLALRSPAPGDESRLAELMADYAIARMTSRVPHPYSLADAAAFVEKVQGNDPAKDHNFVIETEDDGMVGGIGFFTPPGEPLEVGYWIGRDWWGRGFASEALQGALAWAKASWRKRYVVAGHFSDNPASGAVLCKAGFLYTGEVQLKHSLARGEEAATRMMVWLA